MRPLLRWTANFNEFTDTLDAGQNNSEALIVLVSPDTYRQAADLEPDGATVKRVITDMNIVANVSTTSTLHPGGFFLDYAYLVADINSDFTDALSPAAWAGTMINERVLNFGTRDMDFPPQEGADRVNWMGLSEAYFVPHIRIDFNVQAKLAQTKALFLLIRCSSAIADQSEVNFAVRTSSRVLLGGRF